MLDFVNVLLLEVDALVFLRNDLAIDEPVDFTRRVQDVEGVLSALELFLLDDVIEAHEDDPCVKKLEDLFNLELYNVLRGLTADG